MLFLMIWLAIVASAIVVAGAEYAEMVNGIQWVRWREHVEAGAPGKGWPSRWEES